MPTMHAMPTKTDSLPGPLADTTAASPSAATVHEVAREAGVSAATVSRFLNGTAKVSPAKKTAIESAIGKLHYKPNVLAQGLKMGSSRTIGVVTQSLTSGFFAEALKGIEAALSGTGYAPLVVSGHWDAAQEAERIELLIARRVDGVVLLTGNLSDTQILEYARRVPMVVIGRELTGPRAFGCCFDHFTAACEVMEYLIELGHRRIAFIAGPPGQSDARARYDGYCATLARHGIELEPKRVVQGDFLESGGLQGVERLLETGQRFSAIFAANDLTAYGARLALYRRNIRVPEDVSIVGFDDLHSSMYTTPPLTTVRQPLQEAGLGVTQILLKMIQNEAWAFEVPGLNLVLRESVRRMD
jgi:LacI family transcriptional regulator